MKMIRERLIDRDAVLRADKLRRKMAKRGQRHLESLNEVEAVGRARATAVVEAAQEDSERSLPSRT